jgi:hypothetical protein
MNKCLVLLALLASPAAVAHENQDQQIVEPRTVFTIRVQPPALGFANEQGEAHVLVTDLSASVRFLQVLEVGAGFNVSESVCSSGTSTRLQVGVVPGRSDPLAPGAHWRVRMPWLAGYHYYSGVFGWSDCGEGDGKASAHDLSGATGVDATRWGHGEVGFNLRFLVFGGAAWLTEQDPNGCCTTHVQKPYLATTLSVGISFGRR